jgi:cysteine desulfurase family protein
MIYLDNASTSFPKPEIVFERMDKFQRTICANPGRGAHRMAIESAREVMLTRELLAGLFNIKDPSRIVFTLNCTEAINLAIKGLLKNRKHVVISSMEHNSVLRTLTHMRGIGVEFDAISCPQNEELDLQALEAAIKPDTGLIVCTHASNVTGDLLPISAIGNIAKKRGIPFMVDAAQTAGTVPIDIEKDNIDMLAFPGHKGLLGPQGTGGLWFREELDLEPLKYGGTGSHSEDAHQPKISPDRYESGTLNTPGIVGLGAGVRYILDRGIESIRETEIELTEYLAERIRNIDGISFYGQLSAKRKTGIVSFNFEGVNCSEVAHVLDRGFEIAVRSGLHCAPMAHKMIGTFPGGTVRVSLGIFNTTEHIDALINALLEISKEIRKDSSAND